MLFRSPNNSPPAGVNYLVPLRASIRPLAGSTFPLGAELELNCVVEGFPPANSIKWMRDGVELEGEAETTLVLNGTKREDAGAYHCRVENEYGATESNRVEMRFEGEMGTFFFKGGGGRKWACPRSIKFQVC